MVLIRRLTHHEEFAALARSCRSQRAHEQNMGASPATGRGEERLGKGREGFVIGTKRTLNSLPGRWRRGLRSKEHAMNEAVPPALPVTRTRRHYCRFEYGYIPGSALTLAATSVAGWREQKRGLAWSRGWAEHEIESLAF